MKLNVYIVNVYSFIVAEIQMTFYSVIGGIGVTKKHIFLKKKLYSYYVLNIDKLDCDNLKVRWNRL